ncbi:MAG: hypothetical protein OEY44_04265, partial [Candidatus Peregrinibacteria bacterium]|nr:hypothetical protein [Candidatus Peregrinibacteria bacterium]
IPVLSRPVNTIITGKPTGTLQVRVSSFPLPGEVVFSNSVISYHFTISNVGGEPVNDVTLVTYLPEGADCIENCGTIIFNEPLEPAAWVNTVMRVQVKSGVQDLPYITFIGYDVDSADMDLTEVREEIKHPLNADVLVGTNAFTLHTEQVPDLILNSPDGFPRPDQGDITETQYAMEYTGRGKPNTFTISSGYGIRDTGDSVYIGYCGPHPYPHGKGSTVYAYNSNGGGCEVMGSCPLSSSPLLFSISTDLPTAAPELIYFDGTQSKTEVYAYGDTTSVNRYMQMGGVVKAPQNFTLSRAIENGYMGEVNSNVTVQSLTEDLWTYSYAGYSELYATCSCGEECIHSDYYPVYTWQKTSSTPVTLQDDDMTHISVYTSTSWLKVGGGHVGTNGFIQNSEALANRVNLGFGSGQYMESNQYVYDPSTILTPSGSYTPPEATNANFMIFAGQGNEAMLTDAGDDWVVTGTTFPYLQRGDAYDRAATPRDFRSDLLEREKFGEVRVDKLPSTLTGTIDIGDDIVWHQTGDLHIGVQGFPDAVMITGGQARIYVDGNVYINTNMFYETQTVESYNDITTLRIDARNIYVDGMVTDIQALLLARESFHSGESFNQLRLLGDVIAGASYWERKPLIEQSPEEINSPSEYLIEDLRKYVVPAPGDTEVPDAYDIWRQVNPGTGEVLDAY